MVVEAGNHGQLMAQPGFDVFYDFKQNNCVQGSKYAELWHSQHRGGEEELEKREERRRRRREEEFVERELNEAVQKCCGNSACNR